MSEPEVEAGLAKRVFLGVGGILGIGAFLLLLSRVPSPGAASGVGRASGVGVQGLLTLLGEQQRTTAAGRIRQRCAGAVAEGCSCARAAVHEALDASLLDLARELLAQGAVACGEVLAGPAAELLVRAGTTREAEAAARVVLAAHPGEPYATYTLAQARWSSGDVAEASSQANAAVAAGRGSPAHLLVGLISLSRDQLEPARDAFSRALESEPNDAAARYNGALCEHRLNHYNAARAGYLAVLRLNPKHLDARYNLALLTQAAGFRDEATHHLAELRTLTAAGDPRIARLEASLAAPPLPASAAPSASVAPRRPLQVSRP